MILSLRAESLAACFWFWDGAAASGAAAATALPRKVVSVSKLRREMGFMAAALASWFARELLPTFPVSLFTETSSSMDRDRRHRGGWPRPFHDGQCSPLRQFRSIAKRNR